MPKSKNRPRPKPRPAGRDRLPRNPDPTPINGKRKLFAGVFVAVGLATFGLALYYVASGHVGDGIAELVVPIACLVFARLSLRGWRG